MSKNVVKVVQIKTASHGIIRHLIFGGNSSKITAQASKRTPGLFIVTFQRSTETKSGMNFRPSGVSVHKIPAHSTASLEGNKMCKLPHCTVWIIINEIITVLYM